MIMHFIVKLKNISLDDFLHAKNKPKCIHHNISKAINVVNQNYQLKYAIDRNKREKNKTYKELKNKRQEKSKA